MKEAKEAAKRLRTCCEYDSERKCKDCAYHDPNGEFRTCMGNELCDKDIRMIVDFINGMEDDGK